MLQTQNSISLDSRFVDLESNRVLCHLNAIVYVPNSCVPCLLVNVCMNKREKVVLYMVPYTLESLLKENCYIKVLSTTMCIKPDHWGAVG